MRHGDVGIIVAEVGRCHQFRDGFTLADSSEVGLPVFRLTIEAVITSIHSISAIRELVMRCMALGEENEGAIAGMLGLKRDTVESAMNRLVTEGQASRMFMPGGGRRRSGLPRRGERRLVDELEEVPQEEMLVIDYDGIRRWSSPGSVDSQALAVQSRHLVDRVQG